MLLVCRRWRCDPKPPTRVVNLARNPSTPVEALDVAARIERAGASDPGFTMELVDPERIERGDWVRDRLPVAVLGGNVPGAARGAGTLFGGAHSVPMSALAEVGPAGQRIRDAYTYSELPTASGRRALWHHKSGVTMAMRAETDVYIEPKPPRRHLADRYWEKRSNSGSAPAQAASRTVAAVTTPEPAVGSLWTPCRPHDPESVEALCLYLNSSVGLLALLGGARQSRARLPVVLARRAALGPRSELR